jgi:hypothetical protein
MGVEPDVSPRGDGRAIEVRGVSGCCRARRRRRRRYPAI